MTTVLCFGTFDGVHQGHLAYFRQAKEHGDRLFVVVARDATVKKVKGKLPELDEEERVFGVQSLAIVDVATLGNPGDKYAIIEEIKPDVICLGYDQEAFTDKLATELKKRHLKTKVFRMDAYKPDVYKSSILKQK